MQCQNSQGTITLCLFLNILTLPNICNPMTGYFRALERLQLCCKEQNIVQSTKIGCMKTAQLQAKPEFDTDVRDVLKILAIL
jgi:hypothetical protein